MELQRNDRLDGFSAVSERSGEDPKGRFVFAMAAVLGSGGLIASLIFALLGHGQDLTLAIG